MHNLFDELSKKLEADAGNRGISALDLARLSPKRRKLMRLLLREVDMSYLELCQAVLTSKGGGLTQPELDQTLEKLSKEGWLMQMGQGERVRYRVNLRRRRGSSLGSSLWQQLDRRIKPAPSTSRGKDLDG